MKAVWKDETTHAESVYCMCSIPHTAIECYRHPTQPIVVFVLFGVYCAWSLLAFIHIFFLPLGMLYNAHLYKQQHSFQYYIPFCYESAVAAVASSYTFFGWVCLSSLHTHAVSTALRFSISFQCAWVFFLSLSHLSHLTTFVNVNFICEPMYWNIPKKSQATWFSEGTRNTNYSFRCVVQSWCACVVVLKHNHSLLLCLSMYVLWLLLCVHFCDAHREKCCFSEWFSGLIYCILSQKLFHF